MGRKATTFREMIEHEMKAQGDKWGVEVAHNLSADQLRQSFTLEERFHDFSGWLLWTAKRVYFPCSCQDQGGLWVESVPRDPCNEKYSGGV